MMKTLPLLLALPLFLLKAQENNDEPWTLQHVQAYALENAPALERQRLGHASLVEAVEAARAKFDPHFTVRREWQDLSDTHVTEGAVTQTLPGDLEVRAGATHREPGDNEDLTNYSLRLSKTLLGGGTLLESRLPIRRADINEAREWNRLSLEQRRLRLTVTRRYYEIVRSRETLRLRELQLERARLNLEHALVREDPLDIATARLRIPESELDVLATERAIHNALLALKDEIGFPLDDPLHVSTDVVFEVRDIDSDQDLDIALDEHEQLRNARLDMELARIERNVARSRRLPELEARLTVQNREDQFTEGRETDTRGELVLSYPWGERRDRAEFRRRELDLESARVALRQSKSERQREIESLALRLEEAAQTVRLQEARVEVLEQQLQLFRDRWDHGEIGILEYIRSQNNLEDARVQYVTQQLRYLELLAEYDFSVGR